MPIIDHQALGALAARIFAAGGSADDEARLVADHLVEANLCGHDSHGVGMIPRYVHHLRAGSLVPNRRGRVLRDEGAIITYDGERGYGQVVAHAATDLAIRRAAASGIAVVALRNAHHIGRVGAYGEQSATAGMVSLHFVNVIGHEPLVAPHRGRDARLSTNPVCIALPAAEPGRPIVLDMATSKVAMGKVRVARNKGAALPPGLVLDAAGRPSTDPRVMFQKPTGACSSRAIPSAWPGPSVCATASRSTRRPGARSWPRRGASASTSPRPASPSEARPRHPQAATPASSRLTGRPP
jgi:uncharacterized oxidoreductase